MAIGNIQTSKSGSLFWQHWQLNARICYTDHDNSYIVESIYTSRYYYNKYNSLSFWKQYDRLRGAVLFYYARHKCQENRAHCEKEKRPDIYLLNIILQKNLYKRTFTIQYLPIKFYSLTTRWWENRVSHKCKNYLENW